MAASPPKSPFTEHKHWLRCKNAASSTQKMDSASAVADEANKISKVVIKGNRQYHCNYCNKDISGRIHIKCAICSDFDLCVECFSVGAQVFPHESNHPYRVMNDLLFSLLSPDWCAEEEILLLEALEMFGWGDWAVVAEHVGTKNEAECRDHYTSAYLNSPTFPLPDFSHICGMNTTDLPSSTNGISEDNKGSSALPRDQDASF